MSTPLPMIAVLTAVLVLLVFMVLVYLRWTRQRLLGRVMQVTLPDFASRHLGNKRPLYIFLPPNYDKELKRHYPVLYINDGQDMVQLKLHETLATLYHQKRVQHLIVVAIPTNENRLQEYGTAVTHNAQRLGRLAADYSQFVVTEVMPAINEQFRTMPAPDKTAVLGASLGGLSAFDLAWNHPHHFGILGVLSGSFWWRAAADDPVVTPDMLIAHEMVRQTPIHLGVRAWFEAGTADEEDDRDNNGVIDAIQDTVELMEEMAELGYVWGHDMVYVEVENGRHDYGTWSAVLPQFLTWAFPV